MGRLEVGGDSTAEHTLATGRDCSIRTTLSLRGMHAAGLIADEHFETAFNFVYLGEDVPTTVAAIAVESALVAGILADPVVKPGDVVRLPDLEVGELVQLALRAMRDPFRVADAESDSGGGGEVVDAAESARRPRGRSGARGGSRPRRTTPAAA